MKEIKLKNLDDPINFLFELLKHCRGIMDLIMVHPKPSIRLMYGENKEEIERVRRDSIVACNSLKSSVFKVGDGSEGSHSSYPRLVRCVIESVKVAQSCIDLFDRLSFKYDLPAKEYVLFARIGALLVNT